MSPLSLVDTKIVTSLTQCTDLEFSCSVCVFHSSSFSSFWYIIKKYVFWCIREFIDGLKGTVFNSELVNDSNVKVYVV